MNPNSVNLLIIEDHRITAEAYRDIVENIPELNFKVSIADNCDEAIEQIDNNTWDLVLLDLRIPVSKDSKFISGEDIGTYIRRISPKTKIIVITSISDGMVAANIFKKFNPKGFLIKSDIVADTLILAVNEVLKNKVFYSETVQSLILNNICEKFSIDDFDRKILYWLSMGIKTKDICKYVPLSHRAIEVRKTKLREILVENEKSSNLIMASKNLGII